jgi:hypothetical protein
MNDNIKLYNLLGGETPSSTTDLPPPDTKRWVTRRKAVIVNAVRTGVISLEEVCRRYELSRAENSRPPRQDDRRHGLAPVTTKSICRLPHRLHTSRWCQSGMDSSAP